MATIDDCLAATTPLEGLERFLSVALETHREAGFVGGCLWGNTALETSADRTTHWRHSASDVL